MPAIEETFLNQPATVYSDIQLYQLGLTPEEWPNILKKVKLNGKSFILTDYHWVDVFGFNNNDEPIFEIVNLNSFTDKALKRSHDVFLATLDNLSNMEQYGEFDTRLEHAIQDLFYVYDSSLKESKIQILNCREKFCLTYIELDEDNIDNISAVSFHSLVIEMMQQQNGDKVKCFRKQIIGFENKRYFYYICEPINSNKPNNSYSQENT